MEKATVQGYEIKFELKEGKHNTQARGDKWVTLEEKIIALLSICDMNLEKVRELLSYRSLADNIYVNSLGSCLKVSKNKFKSLKSTTHDKRKINVEGEEGYQVVEMKRVHKLVGANFLYPANVPKNWYDFKEYGNTYQVNHINNWKDDNFLINLNLTDDLRNKKHRKDIFDSAIQSETNSKVAYYTRSSKEILFDRAYLSLNPSAKIHRFRDFKGDMFINEKNEWVNIEEILTKCFIQVDEKNRANLGK